MKRENNRVPAPKDERPEPAAGATASLLVASESAPDYGYLAEIPRFGVWTPSIAEAAELVGIDIYYAGWIEGVNRPEDLEGYELERWLTEALKDVIAGIAKGLCSAIDNGKLKASPVRRDFDDQIVHEKTHIFYDDLLEWLEERGHQPGDHLEGWAYDEATISELLCEDLAYFRAARRSDWRALTKIEEQRRDAKYGRLDESQELSALRAALKAKTNKIDHLESKLVEQRSGQSERLDRPLHTRQRRTMLTLIAALCSQCGIEHDARGAAQRIKLATELLGAPIDDGTIDSILKEIPDALESRMK